MGWRSIGSTAVELRSAVSWQHCGGVAVSWQHCGVAATARQTCGWLNIQKTTDFWRRTLFLSAIYFENLPTDLPTYQRTYQPNIQPKSQTRTSRRPSVTIAIPALTASLLSLTDTINCNRDSAYANEFPVAVEDLDVDKLRTTVQGAIGPYEGGA